MNSVGTALKAQLIQIDDLTRSYHVHNSKLEGEYANLEGELKRVQYENYRFDRKLKESGDYAVKYGKLQKEFEEYKTSTFEEINSLSVKYQATNAQLEECQAKLLSQGLQEDNLEKQSKNTTPESTRGKKSKAKLKNAQANSPVAQPVDCQFDEEIKKLNAKLRDALRENIKLNETIKAGEKLHNELRLENYTFRKEVLSEGKYADKEFDKTIDEKINKSVKKFKEKNAVLEEARKELQKANRELESQVSGYQLQISLLQDCQNNKSSVKDQKKIIQKLEKEIAEINLDKEAVALENIELRKTVGELKKKISKLQEQIRASPDTPDDELIEHIFKTMCPPIPRLLSPEEMDYPINSTRLDDMENEYCSPPPPELDMPDVEASSPALLTSISSPKKIEKNNIPHSMKSTEISQISKHSVKKHRTMPDILGTLRYLDKHRMFFTISNLPIKPINKVSRSSLTEMHENVNLITPQKTMQRNSKCQLSCHVKGCCDNSYFLLRSEDDESDLLGFYSVKDETKKKILAIPASKQNNEQPRDHLLTKSRQRRNRLRKSRLSMSANMIIRKLNESRLLNRKKQIRRRNRRTTVQSSDSNKERNVVTLNSDESCNAQNDEELREKHDNHLETETSLPIAETEFVPETQSVISEICDVPSEEPQDISKQAEVSKVILANKHMIKKSALSMLRQKIRKSSATPLYTGSAKQNIEPASEETNGYSPRSAVKRISHKNSEKCKNQRNDSSDNMATVDSDRNTATPLDSFLSRTRRQSARLLNCRQSLKSSEINEKSTGEQGGQPDGTKTPVVEEPNPSPFAFLNSAQSPKLNQMNQQSTFDEQTEDSVGIKSRITQVVFDKVAAKSPAVQEPKPFARIKIQPLQVTMPEIIPVEWTKKHGFSEVQSTTLHENMNASFGRNPSMLSSSNSNKDALTKKSRTIATFPERTEQSKVACDKDLSTECKSPEPSTHLEDCSRPFSSPHVTPSDASVTLPECNESPQSPPLLEKGMLSQPLMESSQSRPFPKKETFRHSIVRSSLEKLSDESEALHRKELLSSCTKALSPENTNHLKECNETPQSPPLLEKGILSRPLTENLQSLSFPKKETLRRSRVTPLEKLSDETEALHRKELLSSCMKALSSENTNHLKAVKTRRILTPNRKRQTCDLVSEIEQAMTALTKPTAKPSAAKIRKCVVEAPPAEEENEECHLPDDSKSDETPQRPLTEYKIQFLFGKLLNYSSEEKALDEVVAQFLRRDSEFVAKAILGRIALDVHDKPDTKCYPAPLMTPTQRVMLGFMLRLEKMGMETICSDFLKVAEQKIIQTIELAQMLPITNLYLAVCKLKKDIHRMRRLCCDVAYFCDNLIVPFLFLVLGSWSDVLPHHNDIAKNPLAKVLVQIVYMKNCAELPGYNLMALRDLLIKYYEYPTERWNSDELFLELYSDYLKKPDRTTDLPILVLCKNHPEEWVEKKIDEYFKPLVNRVPTENAKATVIILIGHLSSWFSKKDKIEEWMESLIEDSSDDVVQRSIHLCLDKFKSN